MTRKLGPRALYVSCSAQLLNICQCTLVLQTGASTKFKELQGFNFG